MTAPLSAFDEIRALRLKLRGCEFDRDGAREQRDEMLRILAGVQHRLIHSEERCARLTAENDNLVEHVARLVRLTLRVNNPAVLAAIDELLNPAST